MNSGSHHKKDDQLDAVFAALADPTRRALLQRLARGSASVSELAAPLPMSQPAVSKHLKVLEGAGLVTRGQDRQRRPATLDAAPLVPAIGWIEALERVWTGRLDRLDDLLEELKATTDPTEEGTGT
ncbi:ArsR/SmtB family transcription factor [Oceanomicrobium pacificus]|uniref:Metalloregulator ArsR/SmtB family transcription factor n=1 Tax=Oceanomicrobium pacificus TaxID=2692916 RepID=A0A6B0TUF3_9RHOB|nr:metalloregulator ArsR/SmtB family transcription factor [Oceanomicrobium pacificus]MXU64593.1 metalloregulator ArsR/SmtB family transcription factor [Oceanomicrobium pacificus]